MLPSKLQHRISAAFSHDHRQTDTPLALLAGESLLTLEICHSQLRSRSLKGQVSRGSLHAVYHESMLSFWVLRGCYLALNAHRQSEPLRCGQDALFSRSAVHKGGPLQSHQVEGYLVLSDLVTYFVSQN